MKRSAIFLFALLAACGPDTGGESTSEDAASDSAALDAVLDPAPEQPRASRDSGVVRSVNGRLERAQKAEAARAEEAAQQVREAEGAAPPP